MKYKNSGYIFILLLFFGKISSQITFSEVMFDVASNEYNDEFVEIYNLSDTDYANLEGSFFSDGSGIDAILSKSNTYLIPPHSFAIILDSSYFEQPLNEQVYHTIIPENVLIFKTSDRAFGDGGLSNSYNEYLSITNSRGDTLTTYRYSTGNSPGHSDEKIILAGDNSQLNWEDSRLTGGTPGFYNSVSPYRIDPGFSDTSLDIPYLIFEHSSIQIDLTIHNFGLSFIEDSIMICLFSDKNENLMYDSGDLLIVKNKILFSDDRSYGFQWDNIPGGRHLVVADILYHLDENTENNIISEVVNVLIRDLKVHINEIKFLTNEGEPEWIELINAGRENVCLKGWGVTDSRDTVLIDTSVNLYPGQMKVICPGDLPERYDMSDSLQIVLGSFINLNDTGDDLYLIEPAGGWKEHISYSCEWLDTYDSRKVSLERINPDLYENDSNNWGPCITMSGATPGKSNSIFSEMKEKNEHVFIEPNPFSPDGDGYEDVTIIRGAIPEQRATIKIQIFDIKGRLIRTLKDNEFSGSRFSAVWDGKDSHGCKARMGIYIIFVQALNNNKMIIREIKTSVILAHKL